MYYNYDVNTYKVYIQSDHSFYEAIQILLDLQIYVADLHSPVIDNCNEHIQAFYSSVYADA